ncbi:hypothetical protein Bca52824_092663 [Brassica carinata]|uniref:F-box domain-containing protein n=1 Tax=Brassica carinata TaxID=52824 RepID=A0A8X7NR58_BRACI|nr:hypothetical protein Bca52824_092663 [Brassica carinata]
MMMEWVVPHDVVELILERVPVRSLLRFKCVSKQWKSTIESRRFQERQLKQRGGDPPDVLLVSYRSDYESLRTLVLGSSSPVKIPTPWDNMEEENTTTKKYSAAVNSCDGLVCLYYPFHSEIGLDNATTCEVFDFSANAWRYVTPSAPYRVAPFAPPVFVDGSLHWFTDCEETKILSFDLHTETFQVISKAPFPANSHDDDNPYGILLCDLDNRLCVSHKTDSNQVIWSFNSSNKTWLKIFSIDVVMTSFFYGCPTSSCPFAPLALLDAENKKKDLLFYDPTRNKAQPSERGIPLWMCNDNIPPDAVKAAMGEIREVMTQYASCADPTESAARKERIRQAEAQGQIETSAVQMVKASMARDTTGPAPPPTLATSAQEQLPIVDRLGPINLASNERVPAADRLGPLVLRDEDEEPRREDITMMVQARKPGRPPGKRKVAEPCSNKELCSRKRKLQQPRPAPGQEKTGLGRAKQGKWRSKAKARALRINERSRGRQHLR